MSRKTDLRFTPKLSSRTRSIVRAVAHGAMAGSLFVGALAWAANRTHATGDRHGAVPGATVAAPAGSGGPELSYLSRLVASELPSEPLPRVTQRIAAVLRRYTRDDRVADRAASAVVREGRKHNVDPLLIVGVMLTENARIDPMARSNVGARGLMQVMPFHSGKWGCDSRNLFNVDANICHGVSILAQYMHRSPSLHKALLRYNGCVRGRNTRNCFTYSRKVLNNANRASKQLVALAAAQERAKRSSARGTSE